MVLVKNCRRGEKCYISAVYAVVTDGRGIVVSVVWFSRGLLCEAGGGGGGEISGDAGQFWGLF